MDGLLKLQVYALRFVIDGYTGHIKVLDYEIRHSLLVPCQLATMD